MFRIVLFNFLIIICLGYEDDICLKECSEKKDDEICSTADCVRSSGRCCWKEDGITIDLRNCGVEGLQADTFLRGDSLHNETHYVNRICLDHNDFGPKNVSHDAFRGLISLEFMSLPSGFNECPGGNAYWENMTRQSKDNIVLCQIQKGSCNVSKEMCPEKSHCQDDGPGLMRCQCNDGYYGYKCLKSGEFPFAAFYGSLGAVTIVASAVLWFVGRRKIGLHTKQS